MKKVKLLPLLAALVLLTVSAQAYGNCAAVQTESPRRIARNCPGTWGRWTWPEFYCPAAAPDFSDAPAAPDTNAPEFPAAAAPDASETSGNDAPAPDFSNVPAPNTNALDNVTPDAAPNANASGNANAPDNRPNTDAPESVSGMSAYETEVVRLVNVERARYGLAALSADAELSRGARLKSQDMRDRGYFSHESPTYGTPFQMMKSLGISYRAAGENIAYGYATPETVVNAWMNSEGHRANILNASYTRLGVGYVADGHYWTQWFVG